MTNEELRARLWEVEKELAESESQMVVGAVLPFVPAMIAKMNANRLQQY
jgi:hypothetical protein